ncbi:MAG: amino acid ABC transporter substrate-binding protein [Candidatus Saccharibacteria bacterium]|nr:amino acid ABC transporter substrate-binding protein [Pseudorhodobacter sp.]
MRALLILMMVCWAGMGWAKDLRIGYLSLSGDPRYTQDWGYARLVTPPPDRTVDGARMAVDDLAFLAEALNIKPVLDVRESGPEGLAASLQAMVADGAGFVVLDLPAPLVEVVAQASADLPVTLINATAPEDSVRSACHPNMLHSGPSLRMTMDSQVQYLRAMNWLRVLVLVGEDPADQGLADAFTLSAERMRLEIVDRRDFTLAANPQAREGNNVKLLTADLDYDVVFVADTRGEFGRYIPYATQMPRPVIGSVGLTAQAWHWAMERDGATQVSSRFDKMTNGRKMSSADWAVWIAVKSVISGYTKVPDGDQAAVRDYLKSPKFRLDGSKGVTLNYRPWDGQLRMPILLATHDAVIAIAPIEGYLHPETALDTLGTDQAEFVCD